MQLPHQFDHLNVALAATPAVPGPNDALPCLFSPTVAHVTPALLCARGVGRPVGRTPSQTPPMHFQNCYIVTRCSDVLRQQRPIGKPKMLWRIRRYQFNKEITLGSAQIGGRSRPV